MCIIFNKKNLRWFLSRWSFLIFCLVVQKAKHDRRKRDRRKTRAQNPRSRSAKRASGSPAHPFMGSAHKNAEANSTSTALHEHFFVGWMTACPAFGPTLPYPSEGRRISAQSAIAKVQANAWHVSREVHWFCLYACHRSKHSARFCIYMWRYLLLLMLPLSVQAVFLLCSRRSRERAVKDCENRARWSTICLRRTEGYKHFGVIQPRPSLRIEHWSLHRPLWASWRPLLVPTAEKEGPIHWSAVGISVCLPRFASISDPSGTSQRVRVGCLVTPLLAPSSYKFLLFIYFIIGCYITKLLVMISRWVNRQALVDRGILVSFNLGGGGRGERGEGTYSVISYSCTAYGGREQGCVKVCSLNF